MNQSLVETVEAIVAAQGGGQGLFTTAMPEVNVTRTFQPMLPMRQVYRPSLCVVLSGGKEILLGSDVFRYGAMECLVVSVELPAVGRIRDASPTQPYLGITVELDTLALREMLEQMPPAPQATDVPQLCAFVGQVDAQLAACLERLVRLTDTPAAVPVLFPLVMKEIYFRLLSGPHGHALAHLALPDSQIARVTRAIQRIHSDIARPCRVDDLAAAASMSTPSFHRNFKRVTGLSPIQFHKQLRLLEARRLMVSQSQTVAEAAYAVGYESVSQFSREYARAFGQPPRRDVAEQLRLLAMATRTDSALVA